MKANEIDVKNAIESIKQGWGDEMVASSSVIDFKDYSQDIDKMQQALQKDNIKVNLRPSFMGLQIDYIR